MDLISRAKLGDREALEALLLRNQDKIESVAKARLLHQGRQRIRASDLVQATFLDVLQSLPKFRGSTDEEFVAWMARILENNLKDVARYQGAKKRRVDGKSGELDLPEDLENPNQKSPSGDAKFADEILLVSRAMTRLSERYRRVLLARLEADPEDSQIRAGGADESSSGTRVLLFRARAALLVEMEKMRNDQPAE